MQRAEALAHLRADSHAANSVLAVTASAMDHDVRAFLRRLEGYQRKPIA